ncbi:hypothetical protein [Niabella drilacis]|uniref:Uncharacterized protein n=1 Tax=Niabella drilacis (strain DSM 25811 / CCM 8410 / CCUG 62505 / LMG 26954 / E90) TaxID=1285928 RepID=A0A1G6T8Z1_NIADE|nr:hypothetical protein [Niabella drilacis]SDD24917.1 hypothetical protein SAMN04487894_107122 [Niabella drilacis]
MKIVIGRRSNGNAVTIHLEGTHLFVSYTEEHQIGGLFADMAKSPDHSVQLFLSASEALKMQLSRYCKNAITENEAVLIEMIHRKLITRQKREYPNTPSAIFVLIEDIWSWVRLTNKKKYSQRLARLLTMAPAYKIFLVCGSMLPLRNLLAGLIANNPKLKNKLITDDSFRPLGTLGAELVYTTEGFAFYKPKGAAEFERMY